jgi:hypothetical protein
LRDDLDDFLDWFLAASPNIGMATLTNTISYSTDSEGNGLMTGVWYKRNNFQVQLVMVSGNYIIPEHIHPNVDSYEVLIGGQMRFSHKGKWLIPKTFETDVDTKGKSLYRGYTIRINHDDVHGGIVGPSGAMYFSVQKWLNDVEPRCLVTDWNGYSITNHKTPDMAASLE